MAYTALDHWSTRVPIARGANSSDQPARTAVAPTAIRNSIWQRLLDSLGPGGVLQRTLEWSLLLNQVPKEFSGGAEGLRNRTLNEWDLLRSHIDSGTPWPIGLVCSNTDVWYQHQILVYGYEDHRPESGEALCLRQQQPVPVRIGRSRGDHTRLSGAETVVEPADSRRLLLQSLFPVHTGGNVKELRRVPDVGREIHAPGW